MIPPLNMLSTGYFEITENTVPMRKSIKITPQSEIYVVRRNLNALLKKEHDFADTLHHWVIEKNAAWTKHYTFDNFHENTRTEIAEERMKKFREMNHSGRFVVGWIPEGEIPAGYADFFSDKGFILVKNPNQLWIERYTPSIQFRDKQRTFRTSYVRDAEKDERFYQGMQYVDAMNRFAQPVSLDLWVKEDAVWRAKHSGPIDQADEETLRQLAQGLTNH